MATETASAGPGAAYEEERRQRILENLKHLESLGISKMAKSLVQATRQHGKSPRASPRPRRKFEAATEVRRSSRAKTTVSYKEDLPEVDNFVRRRRVSKGPDNGRGYNGRISSYQQQKRAFKRAEKFQDSLDDGNLSFVKPMVRSHVSGCFWLGLPSRFCKDHLPPNEYKMVLEDEEGGEFDVVYIGNRTGLSGGWRGFSMHHDLEDGDSLVFELAEPDRFKVYIFKAIEDANEAKPGDKTADVDTMDSDSAQEEPYQTDSPASEPPSSPQPLVGAKRRKLRGR
ncbi:hypothetical protein QYE76_014057 [Lolium multiflorum]|uniref:TF-B3 domain-containing protein n=1 Tax=Lolium multiflorum TaxID=4521 RepID=A0AAD8U007_LOLMU|nr:hypothetical protein QYE76_014057 [Lolium multiflorum]